MKRSAIALIVLATIHAAVALSASVGPGVLTNIFTATL